MRICFLADAASVHTMRFATHFARHGHEVHVLSFRAPGAVPDGVRIWQIPGVPATARWIRGWQLLSLRAVTTKIRQITPDVLHAHYLTSYGLLGVLSQWRPIVVSAWGSDVLDSERSTLLRRVVSFVLRRASAITSDSSHMARVMHRIAGAGCTVEVRVIPFGVPSHKVRGGFGEGRKDATTIGSFRQLFPNYNVDVILEAMKLVSARIPDAVLNVWNTGPDEDRLQSIARELGLGRCVRFGGMIPNDLMVEELAATQVFVSIPTIDATSVTLLEAMAAGSFPVLSDIPANREWIEPGNNGVLVPARDPSALADAIVSVLRDPDRRHHAAERNQEIVRSRAIWEDNMKRFEDLYDEIQGQTAPARDPDQSR